MSECPEAGCPALRPCPEHGPCQEDLDAFAHELAEQIREAAEKAGTVAWAEPMFRSADLIDPMKEGDRG